MSFIAAALCLGVIASLAIAFFLLSWLLCSLVETRRVSMGGLSRVVVVDADGEPVHRLLQTGACTHNWT